METTKRINDLINVTKHLTQILGKENQILRDHEHGRISELIEEKSCISRIYESKYKALEEETNLFTKLDKNQKSDLHELNKEVNNLIEENGTLLNIAIQANQSIVNLVAKAVREASIKTETYGSSGNNALSGAKAEAQSIAFSLDQTL